MLIKNILKYLFLFFIFLSNHSLAESLNDASCSQLKKEIAPKIKLDKEIVFTQPYALRNYGFTLYEYYDENEKGYNFKLDQGYPILATLLNPMLFDDIKSGFIIKKIDNIDLKNINKDEFNEKIFNIKNQSINQSVIEFYDPINKKSITKNINVQEYTFQIENPKFIIKSINNIDTIKGSFELTFYLSAPYSFPNLYDVLKNYKVFQQGSVCNFTNEEVEELGFGILPLEFYNALKIDQDTIEERYELTLYADTKRVFLNRITQGTIEIKNNFKFKKFPFDEQNLKIFLSDVIGVRPPAPSQISSSQVQINEFTVEASNFYKLNNELKEWSISEIDHYTKTFKKVGYGYPFNKLVIDLNLNRNNLYYFIKIIFPIILILSIAWSVFWINPKELESRITTSSVCFLALVAYNFVIDSEIPKLGYMTFMDWIIMISYIFCALPTLLSISFYHILSNKNSSNIININLFTRWVGPIFYFLLLSILAFIILI